MKDRVFVGRERELAELQTFLKSATEGHGQVVFVVGEAGSGKTALVREFARLAQAKQSDLIVAIGTCNAQTGIGDPYLPFREVLEMLIGDVEGRLSREGLSKESANRLRTMVVRTGQVLVEVGPDLVDVLVPGSRLLALVGKVIADKVGWVRELEQLVHRKKENQSAQAKLSEQSHLLEQYTKVLKTLASQQPLLLVIDDMHWADEASINLLFHLGRRIDDSPILIAGTFRPDEVAYGRDGERHPLEKVAAEFKRYFGDIQIDLNQAAETEGRQFVDALLDQTSNWLGESFRQALFQHTGGNALFTIELLRTMQERGDLVQDTSGHLIEGPRLDWNTLPARVEGVIEERISRLEDDLRQILSTASVEGQDFTAQVAAQVQQMQERVVLQKLAAELERRHHLVRERAELRINRKLLSRYQFGHALFQQYVYNELGSGERRLLHGDVARVLEELYSGRTGEIAIQLARHFGEAGEDEKALDYLLQAGDSAARLYAQSEARLHYARALDILSNLPDSEENRRRRVDTIIKQVGVSVLADEPQKNLDRLATAETLGQSLPGPDGAAGGDKLRIARIYYWMGRLYFYRNESLKAINYYRQVLAVAQQIGDPELLAIPSSVLGQVTLLGRGLFGKAEPLLAQAVGSLETMANWPEWIRAVDYLGLAMAGQGKYKEGLAQVERAIQRARETNNPNGTGTCHLLFCGIYWIGRDVARMLEHSYAALKTTEQTGDRLHAYIGYGYRAWAESQLGRHDAAVTSIAKCMEISQSLSGGNIILADIFAEVAAEIALNAGRVAEAIAQATKTVTIAEKIGSVLSAGFAHRTWGLALAAQQPPSWDEAEAHMAAAIKALSTGESWVEVGHTHSAWARICRERGNHDAAREHLQEAAGRFESAGLSSELEKVRAAASST